MSPSTNAERIKWWIVGPAIALWLVAVIALSAFASPTTGNDATPVGTTPSTVRIAEPDGAPSEAPLLTLVVAVIGTALVARPARRALARRRIR